MEIVKKLVTIYRLASHIRRQARSQEQSSTQSLEHLFDHCWSLSRRRFEGRLRSLQSQLYSRYYLHQGLGERCGLDEGSICPKQHY